MAEELKARLVVDASEFRSGMATAAASTRTLKDASIELQAALKDLASAEEELGPAIQNGNEQASSILAEYQARVEALQAEIVALSATEEEETVTLKANISARMAATAEIGLAEGRMLSMNRAAAAYLTTLPGIATAAQAAFSIVGPLAVIAVLGQLVHAINGVVDDYKALSDAASQAAIDQAAAAAHGIVTVQPKVGIGERIARFAKEFTSNADAPNAVQSAGGSDQVVKTASGVERLNAAQTQVLLSQNRLNEAGLKGTDLAKQKQKDLQSEIDLLYKQSNALGDVAYQSQQILRNHDSSNEQRKHAAQELQAATEARDEINTRIQVIGNNKQAEAKVEAADSDRDSGKLARKQMQEAERQFAELNTKLPEEAAAFWRKYVDLFRSEGARAGTEYTAALEKLNRYTDQFEKGLSRQSEVVKKFESERLKLANLSPAEADKSMEEMHKWMVMTEEDITKQGPRWNEYAAAQAKTVEILAQNTEAIDKERIALAQADGTLSPLAARMRLAAIDADEYRRKLAALNDELARLRKEGANLTPGSPEYSQNQTQQAQVQNQILQVQGQSSVSSMKDQQAVTMQMAAPYLKAALAVEKGWERAMTQVLSRQKSFTAAMAQMGFGLEMQLIQSVERWVLKQVESEIIVLAKHTAMKEAEVGVDQLAATQSTMIAAEHGMKEALIDAKGAAVKGWKAGMALPFPEDVVMAPVLAAAGFAGAMAQFDVGTNYVPKTGIAVIHEGERIIPAADNRQITAALGNGGGRGVTHNTVNATVHQNFPQNSKPADAAKGIHDAYRRGRLALS